MQIFPAARLSRRVYRIVICYRSMRVKRGKPSFSPAGCAELAVVEVGKVRPLGAPVPIIYYQYTPPFELRFAVLSLSN